MRTICLGLIGFFLISCNKIEIKSDQNSIEKIATTISTEYHELIIPKTKIKGLLMLFGGYPETASEISKEFPIQKLAIENGIALMSMNFNKKLWLEKTKKSD